MMVMMKMSSLLVVILGVIDDAYEYDEAHKDASKIGRELEILLWCEAVALRNCRLVKHGLELDKCLQKELQECMELHIQYYNLFFFFFSFGYVLMLNCSLTLLINIMHQN